MENPFEIIIEQLTSIEMRLATVEKKLNYSNEEENYSTVMNLNQLCNYCGFTKSFVYKKTSTKEIPHYKRGKKLFFKKEEVDKWIFKDKVKTMDDLQREATRYLISKRK